MDAAVKKIAATNFYHVSTFTDPEIGVIERLATSWPLSKLFPGMLWLLSRKVLIMLAMDLLRLMVLHPHAARRFVSSSLVFKVFSRAVGKEVSILLL